MFAFVIFDRRDRSLFAARDMFGIKPFYYTFMGESFIFGSEIKSFLEHPDFKKELNEEALAHYLSFQYSPTEETFFKGVYKLPPAHYFTFKNGEMKKTRYFKPDFNAQDGVLEYFADLTDKAVRESVAAHKIADVEVGSFLSSGIDSSYIAEAANVDKTFTVGFDYEKYNEIDYAKALSEKIKIDNYSKLISKKEYWDSIPTVQYHMDEPLADAASVALFFVNREAAKQVKVCLSGEGADEFFGGYNIYKEPFTVSWYDHIPLPIRRAIGWVAEQLPPVPGVNFLVRRSRPLEERYIGNTNLMGEKRKKQLLRVYKGKRKPIELSAPYLAKTKGQDPVTRMQYVDMHMWMVGDILLKADKMSMANSLELRVPFLDKEVFELARHIPAQYRANGENTKIAMRGAALRSIPEAVAEKKKLGFPVPVRAWLRDEKYASTVRAAFESDAAREFFNVKELERMLDQHMSGKRDNWRQIWCVFIFLVWYNEYFVKR